MALDDDAILLSFFERYSEEDEEGLAQHDRASPYHHDENRERQPVPKNILPENPTSEHLFERARSCRALAR